MTSLGRSLNTLYQTQVHQHCISSGQGTGRSTMGLKHCSSCGAAPLRPPRKHSFSIIFLSYLHHEIYWSVSSLNPNMTCQHLKCQNHAGIATDTRAPMLFRCRSTEKRWNLRVHKLPPTLETYDCTTCSQEWASRSLFQHRNETAQNLQWICRTWATVTLAGCSSWKPDTATRWQRLGIAGPHTASSDMKMLKAEIRSVFKSNILGKVLKYISGNHNFHPSQIIAILQIVCFEWMPMWLVVWKSEPLALVDVAVWINKVGVNREALHHQGKRHPDRIH